MTSNMLHLRDRELTQHINGCHLWGERLIKIGTGAQPIIIGNTKLTVTVDRGRSVEVTRVKQIRHVRLIPCGQCSHESLKVSYAAIRPGQDQQPRVLTSSFLEGHIRHQRGHQRVIHLTLYQAKRKVPSVRDHSIRPLLIRNVSRKHDHVIPSCRSI